MGDKTQLLSFVLAASWGAGCRSRSACWRFTALLVDSDAYLLELARYIVLNPVLAGVVKKAADWPWSSYRASAGLSSCAAWLAADALLAQFPKRRGMAQQRYAQVVVEGRNAASPWSHLKGQVFLGDDEFVRRMQSHLKAGQDDVQIPRAQRRAPPPALAEIERRAKDRNAAIIAAYATGEYSYAA